jgi:ribulose-5-phosphate 4-epimerase/fuculose-1-phosphate aldolase
MKSETGAKETNLELDFWTSEDPEHPANLIPELCRLFYNLGWVTGTGGGISIKKEYCISNSAIITTLHLLVCKRNEWYPTTCTFWIPTSKSLLVLAKH